MAHCTGGWRMLIMWRLLRTDCHLMILIIVNGFGSSWLGCYGRNVQANFERRGKRQGNATWDWWQIGLSMQATRREATFYGCQIKPLCMIISGGQIARISFYLPKTGIPGYECEALGAATWYCCYKQRPKSAIHTNINVQVHLSVGQIGWRVFQITYLSANDNYQCMWPDFDQLRYSPLAMLRQDVCIC